ncbi:MAG: peptidylprolyl isomerase [Prevotella sp.]|nr:peptidylprolyl isomerase [Prevotella sp.]
MTRVNILLGILLTTATTLFAQNNDPVIMTVNGQPVLRSEFVYSYNKNNSEGVIDKKTVEEYVDLFINYKLKVMAALDEHLDTLVSFKQEFATYRDQQVKPSFFSDSEMEAEARKIYNNTKEDIGPKGLVNLSHILIRTKQQGSAEDLNKARQRIDSVYNALKNGADFAALAKRVSEDPGSAANGGKLSWIRPKQTLKEFEDAAYALNKGEISAPVLSPVGYHVILMHDRKQLEPYEDLKESIYRFIENRGLKEQFIDKAVNEAASQAKVSTAELLERRAAELSATDSDMKNLIREYHDGLLLYEISNRMVWEKAASDEAGLSRFFQANRKKYNWEQPRYKGIAYNTKDKKDIKAVKKTLKGLPFDSWAEKLRTTFNGDSVIRIRVVKGIFKEGDNKLIDNKVFKKKGVVVPPVKDYPYEAVYGKLLKKGPETYDDVRGQVVADYQDQMEKEWVASLRRRYPVVVNQEVVKTVK